MRGDLKYTKLSALQTTEVVLALRQHFDTEKGAYHDGWNDKRVAEHVKCNPAGVERIRSQNFGRLRSGYASNAALSAKVTEQAMLIDALTEDMSKLRDDFVQLVTTVRYFAHDSSMKTALLNIEKRYPQFRGLMDIITNTPRGSSQ